MNQNDSLNDVIIIGGGAAGMSAALWCSELGLTTVLLEKEAELGGQLLQIFNPVKNYIGTETSNGREMRDLFLQSIEKGKFLRRPRAEAVEIDVNDKIVILKNGEKLNARAFIIATGVRRRKLGVPGEDHFWQKGIIESGSKDKEEVKGKSVLIVGGGDAALENALILSGYASRIYLVHRKEEFSARTEFLEQAKKNPKVQFYLNTIVREILGNEKVEAVKLENVESGESEILAVDKILIRIGVLPNTEILNGKIDLDDRAYIRIDATCETSAAGVFAIGDAANPTAPTISTATGTGATAAKAINALLTRG